VTLLCGLAALALFSRAARWSVVSANDEPLGEVDVRRFDSYYYLALDDLSRIFNGKTVGATVRYRYVAPTKTLTLQVRTADEVISLRMSVGSPTVHISGGRAFSLRSDLKEIEDTVWVPLQVLTDVLPTLLDASISYRAEGRRIIIKRPSDSDNGDRPLPSEELRVSREERSSTMVESPGVTSTPSVGAPVWSELVVALNAGHGGADPGAQANGLVEKVLALDVVQRIQRLAESSGAKSFLVRKGDYTLPMASRVVMAREQGANVYLSVHFNAAVETSLNGYRIYVNYPTPAATAPARGGRIAAQWAHVEASRKLAALLDSALSAAGFEGERPLGLPLAEFEQTRIPSVLVELAFLSNPSDAAMWMKPETLDRAAGAIWGALAQFQP